jgi:hypothetical protein
MKHHLQEGSTDASLVLRNMWCTFAELITGLSIATVFMILSAGPTRGGRSNTMLGSKVKLTGQVESGVAKDNLREKSAKGLYTP